jgi:hypothetical protein
MTRYYALVLNQEKTQLIRAFEGKDIVLAELPGGWQWGQSYELNLKAEGNRLTASVNGAVVLEAEDPDHAYSGGGIGIISEVGRIAYDHVEVHPIS